MGGGNHDWCRRQLHARRHLVRSAVEPANPEAVWTVDAPAGTEIEYHCTVGTHCFQGMYHINVVGDGGVDVDEDGVEDEVDNCPEDANVDQADGDADGVGDVCDNCPDVENFFQDDADADGFGDAATTARPTPMATRPTATAMASATLVISAPVKTMRSTATRTASPIARKSTSRTRFASARSESTRVVPTTMSTSS